LKKKINDYFEFPFEFNVQPYTFEAISRREAAAAGGGADSKAPPPATAAAAGAGAAPTPASKLTPVPELKAVEEYQYRLVGVLVHTGMADAGHYYSYMKNIGPDGKC
jgi:hypothetical protein